jgi:hypothetical protein
MNRKVFSARGARLGCLGLFVLTGACSTLPTHDFRKASFPKKSVFLEEPLRPYVKLGLVRTRIDYPSLDIDHEERALCRNAFNQGARDLLKQARKNGGNAVIGLRSVVFYETGRFTLHAQPECADDGEGGQILMQGIAIRYAKAGEPQAVVPAALKSQEAKSPTSNRETQLPAALPSSAPLKREDFPGPKVAKVPDVEPAVDGE